MSVGAASRPVPPAPHTDAELEERLSRPTPEVAQALRTTPGDVIVLGAGGKMGPSLTAMLVRAAQTIGDSRRVIAVSRWNNAADAARLETMGAHLIRADLLEPQAIEQLPDAPNVIFMVGQKFGTRDAPALTWMTNTVLPARAAERYRDSRIVAFSTGNVYALSPISRSGSVEEDTLSPIGEYAASCVGRERVFEYAAARWSTRVAMLRLNYAVDLRYGVLVDLARRILAGEAIDLRMGYVNCIWQGDANAMALRALAHASAPPFAINVTGPERLSVREVAREMGRLLGREPQLVGHEADDALLSDTQRGQALFGAPSVAAATLIAWVVEWVLGGGRTLGRATSFERRDGSF